MAKVELARRGGPRAGATRAEVLAVAKAHFLECRRVEVRAVAAECGVGRATAYRWFGSREGLVAEAMLAVFEGRVTEARKLIGGRGAGALLDTIDLIYRGLVAAPHVRALIDREPQFALHLMTSSRGQVHPRIVALIKAMIDDEVEAGAYRPPADPQLLAYMLVRLAEAALFNYAADDIPKDMELMREGQAVILGVKPEPAGSPSRGRA